MLFFPKNQKAEAIARMIKPTQYGTTRLLILPA